MEALCYLVCGMAQPAHGKAPERMQVSSIKVLGCNRLLTLINTCILLCHLLQIRLKSNCAITLSC